MGVWHISADTVAGSRFATSALAETIAVFHALNGRGAHPSQQSWVGAHVTAYREYLASDPFATAFVNALSPNWVPDFMFRPPLQDDWTMADELTRVRQTPADTAIADLVKQVDVIAPPRLFVDDLPDRVANLLGWMWESFVRLDWPRRKRAFEADIVARNQQLGSGGWAVALSGMRQGMRWLGEGQLQINTYQYPPRELGGAELLFIPSTARRGWVASDEAHHRYAVIYPCSGLLAENAVSEAPLALSRLLGAARAAVLSQLDAPKSTTQLVALTGYGLGSVGGHLKVLLDARLVCKRRAGRLVLYYRTPVGDHLVSHTVTPLQRSQG